MTRKPVSLLVLVFSMVAFAVGSVEIAAADDSACETGYVCFWTGQNYTGNKTVFGASYGGTGWQPFTNYKFALKNHFTDRAVWVRAIIDSDAWVICYNPGWEVPQSFALKGFKVSGLGGRC
jgi:hypothetical protein